MTTTSPSIPVAWPLRLWLGVEVLFGVGALLAIGLAPADSATNFAWPINPVVMAALLGGFYITTAPLFLLPLLAKRWEMIRVMILPTAIFTTMQLIATFLHWDKFSVGTLPFYIWFASYLLPPPIFVGAYLWHQRKAGAASAPSDLLPKWLYWLMLILGVALTVGGLLVFAVPTLLIPVFPWTLTPLTGRSLSAWVLVVGTILFAITRENNRTRGRLVSPMLILLLPVLLMQMLRYADQVNWSSPVLWLGLVLLSVVAMCGVVLAIGSWHEALS